MQPVLNSSLVVFDLLIIHFEVDSLLHFNQDLKFLMLLFFYITSSSSSLICVRSPIFINFNSLNKSLLRLKIFELIEL
jgi:hypothetical protein